MQSSKTDFIKQSKVNRYDNDEWRDFKYNNGKKTFSSVEKARKRKQENQKNFLNY